MSDEERSKIMDNLIAQDADLIDVEPVAYRYGFDGYGWQYIDSGSGSDWAIRHPDGEPLYAHPPADRLEAIEAENERLREALALKDQYFKGITKLAALGETFEVLGPEFEAVWDANRDKLYEDDTK